MFLPTFVVERSTTNFKIRPSDKVVATSSFIQSKTSTEKGMCQGNTGTLAFSNKYNQVAPRVGHHLKK